ncbi:RNA lariat debranching enzyme [Ascosphaera apis ARSEF 7405]|uniref:RNA lariat debranching enzyme n=1 Tax=Ascosphaera apis ARSEF 7405 TaxID=392613 RepID=A0A167V9V7_9EURO|nr:RNA lariat debranching enzyme [Ascosphaera apis ARSEF 7405]
MPSDNPNPEPEDTSTKAYLAEVTTPDTMRHCSRPLRLAFEGCGHGMLDDIYSAIKSKSEQRGWSDGVDLVIIGGDFQAVRNPADLTCLSVPQKYRRLGDFPAYYSGEKKAPYLTLFVGGNHEASNYMQELYYGGWVAPNIYYLGAANVVKFAGLRIAGLSGIFAAYDYARHHFERLPYNTNDQKSAYHVRQIDVRKLMQVQQQVDIVVSHDWPQGIEYHGNYEQLFRCKRDFRQDSESGKLGSPAARDLMNRLRPRLWLAAHLHVKFEALVEHREYNPLSAFVPHTAIAARQKVLAAESATQAEVNRNAWLEKVREAAEKAKEIESENAAGNVALPVQESHMDITPHAMATTEPQQTDIKTAEDGVSPTKAKEEEEAKTQAENAEKISAWNNFHSIVDEEDAARLKDTANDMEVEDDTNYQVTWKKIKTGVDGTSRVDAGVETFGVLRPGAPTVNANDAVEIEAKNPDEIDLDFSDVDEGDQKDGVKLNEASMEVTEGLTQDKADTTTTTAVNPDEIDIDLDADEEIDLKTNEPTAADAPETAAPLSTATTTANPDEIQVDLDTETPVAESTADTVHPDETVMESVQSATQPPSAPAPSSTIPAPTTDDHPSQVMRADGAIMATTIPAGITNTTTRFLSLDKIELARHRQFLDLMEVPLDESVAALTLSDENESGNGPSTPPEFKLEYDPEWLAITKALAPELVFGCEPDDPVPADKGDVGYQSQIASARAWVEENIVAKDKLAIPHNFAHTAAPITDFNDPEQTRIPVGMAVDLQPKEYTNPQTVAYCAMLEIENIFDMTEEEREARRARGPRPEQFYPRANKRNFNGPRGPGGGGGSMNYHQGNMRRGGGGGGGFGGGRGGRGGNRGQGRSGGGGRDWSAWYNSINQQQRQDGGAQGYPNQNY